MLRQDRRAGAVDATLLWTGATASVLLLATLMTTLLTVTRSAMIAMVPALGTVMKLTPK